LGSRSSTDELHPRLLKYSTTAAMKIQERILCFPIEI